MPENTDTDTEAAATIEARYMRRANAAAQAALNAVMVIDPGFSGATQTAKINAAGRIAAALIRADARG